MGHELHTLGTFNPVQLNVQWLGIDTQYLSSPTSLLLLSVEAAIARFKVQGFPAPHAMRCVRVGACEEKTCATASMHFSAGVMVCGIGHNINKL